MHVKNSTAEDYQELAFYTLEHSDKDYFIHQHIVDTFQAQTADEFTKPIAIVFSLAGLYLFTKQGYTGKMVQQVHMKMARNKIPWPAIELPVNRGDITISNVLESPPGTARDEMIKKWSISVWHAFENSHQVIKSTIRKTTGI